MDQYRRLAVACVILLSGLLLLPQVYLVAGVVEWERYAGAYEDTVVVTRARYDEGDQELEVRANSSQGGAVTLTVYDTDTNALIGTLTYDGSRHEGTFFLPTNPMVITVRSSGGGEATVLVTDDSDPPATVTPTSEPLDYHLYLPIAIR